MNKEINEEVQRTSKEYRYAGGELIAEGIMLMINVVTLLTSILIARYLVQKILVYIIFMNYTGK